MHVPEGKKLPYPLCHGVTLVTNWTNMAKLMCNFHINFEIMTNTVGRAIRRMYSSGLCGIPRDFSVRVW